MRRLLRTLILLTLSLSLLLLPVSALAAGGGSSGQGCSQPFSTSCQGRYLLSPDSGCGWTEVDVSGSDCIGRNCADANCADPDGCRADRQSTACRGDECADADCAAASCPNGNQGVSPATGGYNSWFELLRSYLWSYYDTYSGNSCANAGNRQTLTNYGANYDAYYGAKATVPALAADDEDSGDLLSNYAREVVELVNQERAAEGLAPLSADPDLTDAAGVRADEIRDQFSHTRPDGTSCFTALDATGANYRRAGENIAIGQQSPARVVAAWMDSPGHRANIMNANYSRIGVAVETAGGSYAGYAWAQFFAD